MCLNCTLLGECPSFSFLSYPIYKLSPGDENANTDTNTKLRNERPLHSFLKLYLYLYLYICWVCWNALRPLLGSTFFKGVPLLPSFQSSKNTNALILFSILFLSKRLFCLLMPLFFNTIHQQVWSLTQFYYVSFLQSKKNVKIVVYRKNTIRVCISYCW